MTFDLRDGIVTAPDPVMAAGTWANNAELIRDAVVPLGYLRAEWRTLDPTYGLGRFWRLWRPDNLVASDLDPAKSPAGVPVDFRHLPHPDACFDAVVFDPPYKLNGTSTGKGAATCDEDYGVEKWMSLADRHQLITDGITEATRVLRPGGMLLVKCQDQVNGGKVRWQTRIFADHAETLGHRLVDRFDLASYRAQPAGRRQLHARRNTSALLVLRLERSDHSRRASPRAPSIPGSGCFAASQGPAEVPGRW